MNTNALFRVVLYGLPLLAIAAMAFGPGIHMIVELGFDIGDDRVDAWAPRLYGWAARISFALSVVIAMSAIITYTIHCGSRFTEAVQELRGK